MKACFFTAVRNLRVSENLGAGEKFGDLKLTNEQQVVRALIPGNCFRSIGTLELNALFDKGSIVFYQQFDLAAQLAQSDFIQKLLVSRVALVQTFHTALWMQQDAATNSEMAYLVYGAGYGRIDSNFLGVHFTNSKGRSPTVELTREELRRVRLLGTELLAQPTNSQDSVTQLTTSSPRPMRALYFVNGARAVNDLSIKIAHYCTAFETLLSTSHSELAHQLSERVSFFLAKDGADRAAIYRQLKEAYGYRSKVVHGASISDRKVSELEAVATRCDDYARRLINLVREKPVVSELFQRTPEEFEKQLLTWTLTEPVFSNLKL